MKTATEISEFIKNELSIAEKDLQGHINRGSLSYAYDSAIYETLTYLREFIHNEA